MVLLVTKNLLQIGRSKKPMWIVAIFLVTFVFGCNDGAIGTKIPQKNQKISPLPVTSRLQFDP